MTGATKTTPRWIAEAVESVSTPASDALGGIRFCPSGELSAALIERLPLEAITLAAVMNPPEARCAAIIAALTEDAAEAVRHVDPIHDVARVLDESGVPRLTDVVVRIRLLVRWANQRELAREREAKEANRWAGEARAANTLLGRINHMIGVANTALIDAGAPMGDDLETEQGVIWLHRELMATRRQRDGAADDLHRERCAHQEAASEAAARELRLTEERDAALARVAELERRIGGG